MSSKQDIIAIFKDSNVFLELKNLLEEDGFKVKQKKLLKKFEPDFFTNCLLLVNIDSQEILKRCISLVEKEKKNFFILGISRSNLGLSKNYLNFKMMHKPIVLNECLGIVKKFLKTGIISSKAIRFGDLLFYPHKLELVNEKDGVFINLTELENKFLKHLLKKKDGSKKSEILSEVWGHNKQLQTHTLESLIYRLRRKIEKNPNSPKFLVQIEKKYFIKT